MDGPEGETHVEFGAKVMSLFDYPDICLNVYTMRQSHSRGFHYHGGKVFIRIKGTNDKWSELALYHSRYYAKKDDVQPSKLCLADKLAVCLEPSWLYLPRVNWSGEIHEYMKMAGRRKYEGEPLNKYESMGLEVNSQKDWFKSMTSYLKRWVEEHKDGKEDTWTPNVRKAVNQEGVYQ